MKKPRETEETLASARLYLASLPRGSDDRALFDLASDADVSPLSVSTRPRCSRDFKRSDYHFPRLPGTREEGESVAELLGVQPWLEDAALDTVAVGDTVVVFPHETCPVDGTVIEGHGTMDESYLTGEPYLISKAPGAAVLSGAVNGDVKIRARGREYSPEEISAFILQEIKEFSEEALGEDNLDGYQRLASAVRGAIAAGETEATIGAFEELLRRGVKVLQPDVGRAGGLDVCREVSQLAARAGAWCVPHCFGTGVNLTASLQWVASADEAPFIEFPVSASDLRNNLVMNPPKRSGCWVIIPEEPGLGVSIDEEVVRRYRQAHEGPATGL